MVQVCRLEKKTDKKIPSRNLDALRIIGAFTAGIHDAIMIEIDDADAFTPEVHDECSL